MTDVVETKPTGVPVTPENKPEEKPAEKPATETVTPEVPSMNKSAQFAALARKDRQIRAAMAQAKKREEDLSKREALIAEREKAWDSEFRSSPLDALKKRGIQYDDITKAALNDGKFQPDVEIKSVKEEIEKIRQEQAEKEKQALEEQKNKEAAQQVELIENFKGQIKKHVQDNGEKFELIGLYEANDLVFQTVEEHFNRTQKVLSIEEACGLVENYLESELERTAKTSKKFQAKFASAVKTEQTEKKPTTSTTLNNSMNQSAAPILTSKKVDDDRMSRALAALG